MGDFRDHDFTPPPAPDWFTELLVSGTDQWKDRIVAGLTLQHIHLSVRFNEEGKALAVGRYGGHYVDVDASSPDDSRRHSANSSECRASL